MRPARVRVASLTWLPGVAPTQARELEELAQIYVARGWVAAGWRVGGGWGRTPAPALHIHAWARLAPALHIHAWARLALPLPAAARLAAPWRTRRLPYGLARQVAEALTEKDVIRAHARDELGIGA